MNNYPPLSETGYTIASLEPDDESMVPPSLADVIAGVWGDDGRVPELMPYRADLVRFRDVMFKHADRRGFVSFRVFLDNGDKGKPALVISATWLDDPEFVDLMMIPARTAASWDEPAVFAPPVCTFRNARRARGEDLYEGLGIAVECDEAPSAARVTLEALLGPATLVIESGGEWVNPATGEIEPKLHLYWRLKVPARSEEDHALLYEARELATQLVGGDPSANSIVHPMRWPGSWHRKGKPRLAKIAEMDDDAEIDLGEALEKLRETAGTDVPRSYGDEAAVGDADDGEVTAACVSIPNPDLHWGEWNRRGMAIWRATGGSEQGRLAFHALSRKSKKYDARHTEKKWRGYFRSPPTRIGFGTLCLLASQADPGWRERYDEEVISKVDIEPLWESLRAKGRAMVEARMASGGAQTGTGNGSASAWASGAWSYTPPSRIKAKPFVLRDPRLIPKRQWLYGTHLLRKFGSATFAPSGSGKSNLMIIEALALATGRDLVGILPPERSRVWYWNGEDPYDEIERRIGAACLYYGIAPEELDGWLFVNSGRDPDSKIVIATETREGFTIAIPMVEALIETIRDDNIDVVMIDPFISSHKVPENNNNAIDTAAKAWTGIADVTDTAIDLAHHTRKTGGQEVTVEDGRGAVALLNAVRPTRVINVMTEDEATAAGVIDGRRRYFRVNDGKNNLALSSDKQDWFRSASIDLGNGDPANIADGGDNMGVVTRWNWPNPMDGVTGGDFDKAAAAIRAGEWRLNNQAKAWVGHAVAKALGLGDVRKKSPQRAKVIGLVGTWIYTGALVVVERLDSKLRKIKEFVEVAEEEDGD